MVPNNKSQKVFLLMDSVSIITSKLASAFLLFILFISSCIPIPAFLPVLVLTGAHHSSGVLVLAQQQQSHSYYYETAVNPSLIRLFVNPTTGNDSNTGLSKARALRTLSAAWNKIPSNGTAVAPPDADLSKNVTSINKGYLINLAPGTYLEYDHIPNYFESKHGTFDAPIIILGPKTAVLQGYINIFDCSHFYMIGMTVRPLSGDVVHCEKCDHVLFRKVTMTGRNPDTFGTQETLKINQSQYVYIEKCNISGAWDNAIDFVAVQYGHVVQNRIHNAGDWCAYAKGGSAYLRYEGNRFYNCGTGGFTAGQGTGFEYMQFPWLQYEAYDIKFFNNIVHHTDGAAVGINGGYNILVSYNTFYHVGRRSHGIEVVFGIRSCDGDTSGCQGNRNLGGWGPISVSVEEPIPNRNVIIANNVLYNPLGFQSTWQHFAIYDPRTPSMNSNIPSPARTDTGLVIRGNILWNGPENLPLGLGDQACTALNPTCNEAQVQSDNKINNFSTMSAPLLKNPPMGDYRPISGGSIMATNSVAADAFTNDGRPEKVPVGDLENTITADFSGTPRLTNGGPPGAYARPRSKKNVPPMPKLICGVGSAAAATKCLYSESDCSTEGAACGNGKVCILVSCY